MLVFKDIKNEEQLLNYLTENGLEDKESRDGIFFGGFEDEKLFGIAEAYLDNEKVYLGMTHVIEAYLGQGMEEAIIRSLLNKLELKHIKFVYSFEQSALLDKIGFIERDEGYGIDLVKLFNSSCSCCGGESHEE